MALLVTGLSRREPLLTWIGGAIAAVGLLFLALAALSRSADAKTQELDGKVRDFWSRPPLHLDVGESPEIPAALQHWRRAETWHPPVRVFDHTRTPVVPVGPDDIRFPNTQNGCDSQQFLVRWRSMAEPSTVAAGAVNAVGEIDHEVSGKLGWMILDGCRAPGFRFVAEPRGSTMIDVAVEVQRWVPAP